MSGDQAAEVTDEPIRVYFGDEVVPVASKLLSLGARTSARAARSRRVALCPHDLPSVIRGEKEEEREQSSARCKYPVEQCSFAHVKDGHRDEVLAVLAAEAAKRAAAGIVCLQNLANYRVILVDPQDSRNIGAVARLCANFGISDTWVVSQKQVDWECKRRKRCQDSASTKAKEALSDDEYRLLNPAFWRYAEMLATPDGLPLLHSFNVVSELSEALEGVGKAVAFTGKVGASFRQQNVDVTSLPAFFPKNDRAALVFGNEAKGLSSNDTLLCSGVCTLSTSPLCTSLNLSHAVSVVLSRLWESSNGTALPHNMQPPANEGAPAAVAPDSTLSSLREHCREALETSGYPCSKTDWQGANRRRNKFAYRCHKHVTALLHVAQRAGSTEEEIHSIRQVVSMLQAKGGQLHDDDNEPMDADDDDTSPAPA
ncbi:hypothetical protein DIPPA_31748 [Diplonema papillatum]|nr:hypothetical protein DIPPA_31748 [Diplonema papillatum]